jgi:hypothetical protein
VREEHPVAEDVQGQRSEPAGPSAPSGARRGLIAALAVVAAVVTIAVPMALAERSRADPAAAAAPTPFIEGQPPSLPPLPPQPDPEPVPANAAGVKGLPDENGCPVDAPRLLAALRAGDLHQRLAAPRELTGVDCYATYALARTGPGAGGATVIFRYAESTDSWRAVSAGTSAACADVPQPVREHLQACG